MKTTNNMTALNWKKLLLALLAMLLLLTVVLLPGCKKKPSDEKTSENPSGLVTPDDAAPDFTVQLVDGSSFKLSDARGKVVLLYFFSRESNQSMEGIAAIRQLATDFADKDVLIQPIDLYDDADSLLKRMGKDPFTYKVGLDQLSKNAVSKAFRVAYLPGTFLIDQEGIVKDVYYGNNNQNYSVSYYTEKINALLGTAG